MHALLALFISMTLFSVSLPACSCSNIVSAPACQRIADTAVIFVGTVVNVEPDPMTPNYPRWRVYRFQVERAYKGIAPATQQVVVNPDNMTSCHTEYRKGIRYLMFGSKMTNRSEILAGGCSGSREVQHASSDVQFLEAYMSHRSQTEIYGNVLQWTNLFGRPNADSAIPVPGALVTLIGSGSYQQQIAASDGAFHFLGIQPGSYTVSAEKTQYQSSSELMAASVTAGTCAEVFPSLSAHSEISGILHTFSGLPARKIRIELLRKNAEGRWAEAYQFWTYTDAQGRFKWENLPSGDYLLGYEIQNGKASYNSPFETVYYPGVKTRAEASVLHLEPNQTTAHLSFHLPKPDIQRSIQITVVWPDGQPVTHNLLQLTNGNSLVKNLDGQHNGTFIFTSFAHRTLELSVRYWIDDLRGPVPHDQQQIAKSNVITIHPGSNPVKAKLILEQKMLADGDR